MKNFGFVLFGIYLLVMLILDVIMFVSWMRPGDERKQLIVWKASTFTLAATMGGLVFDIVESLIKSQPQTSNPFILLSATATIYFITMVYYHRKYGN